MTASLWLVACGVNSVCPPVARAEDRHVERRVAPVYPEIAKRMHIGGMVHVTVTIAADGTVVKAVAVTGNRMLTPAAEEAVKQWKFASATGESTMSVDVNFQMN